MSKKNDKPILIYIGGYGRSGSSILEAALHTIIKDSSSLGEVATILDNIKSTRLGCACGDLNYSCAPWSKVRNLLRDKSVEIEFQRYSNKEMFGLSSDSAFAESYGFFWLKLFRLRTQNRVIIDSSKTSYRYCNRAKIMAESNCYNVFFIHINRSVAGVLKSRLKGTNKKLSGVRDKRSLIIRVLSQLMWPVVTVISWNVANHCAKKIYRSKYLSGKIEIDFSLIRKDPLMSAKSISSEIEKQLNCTLDVDYNYAGPIVSGHSAEGNRSIRKLSMSRV